MKPRTRALALAGVLAIAGVACTYVTPDASNFECVWHGGTWDSKEFERTVAPSSGRTGINMSGSHVSVPTNVRSFDEGDGLPPVTVNVRGVPLTFAPSLTFVISSVPDDAEKPDGMNAGCDLVQQHLRPLDATNFNESDITKNRWVQAFLIGRVAPVVRDVAPRVLQDEDPTAIAFNTDGARDAAATSFGVELNKALQQQLGRNYFCAPSYRYGESAESCGNISVVLPEPGMSDDDRELLAKPQRAKTEADNEIAAQREAARKASEIAAQLEVQAQSAEQAATARETIAQQEARVAQVDVETNYEWCRYLAELGQDCALVKAAEMGTFPSIFTSEPPTPVVPVTPEGVGE